MNASRLGKLALILICLPGRAEAGFTETAPANTFVIDESINISSLQYRYDDGGNKVTLIDPVERYELGSGLQGTLIPNAVVEFAVLINMLQYGVTDNLTVGVGIPVVLYTDIDLDLGWIPGDYQSTLARSYTEEDFWAWAGSLGQGKPQDVRTNKGVMGDLVLGVRYRFSDDVSWFSGTGLSMAVSVLGALPTGKQGDPEEIASVGTTMWDLHSQGELGFHLSLDWKFPGVLRDRLLIGVDVFYEFLFEHEYKTPTGVRNPLLLNYADYVGETYTIDPGDFSGISLQLDTVIWDGPALATWLTAGDQAKANDLPPLLKLSLRYKFTNLGQSDWKSKSAIWDWEREKLWLPGHKNTLQAKLGISLLRVGIPAQLYVAYRNQTWIAGRNSRAADVITAGLTIPARFW